MGSMQLGLRFKLVLLMILSGVLPLLAALTVLELEGGRQRTASIGQSFLSVANSQAQAMLVTLQGDIEGIIAHARDAEVIETLTARSCPDRLTEAQERELARLDKAWPTLARESAPVTAVLDHPLAEILRRHRRANRHCKELFLTDALGRLVAASDKTSDYRQADETWWQKAYHDGEGKVYVSEVDYDRSSHTWGVDVCVPVYGKKDGDRRVIGVIKGVMDLQVSLAASSPVGAGLEVSPILLQEDGRIVFARGVTPLAEHLPGWRAPRTVEDLGHWRVTGGNLQAMAILDVAETMGEMEMEAPRWYLLVQAPTRRALAAVYRIGLYVLLIGLGLIALTFGLSLYLANRNIVLPLTRLRTAAERIATGDLTHRIELEPRRFGAGDEIGQLASDFNRMAVAIEKSHAVLAEADETKARFIRIAGHELRTPLSYILTMVSLLNQGELGPSVRTSLAKLGEKARRLETIITEMFKLAGERIGGKMLRLTRFDAFELAEEVAVELRPFAGERSQPIMTHRPPDPLMIQADREKLRDAVTNLVTNAIKFSPDGAVITVSVAPQLGDQAAISVRDQGSGISEEERPHIFQAFWGATDLLKHSSGEFGYQKRGAGLGLAIAQHFVHMHGGTIEVDSSPNGSTFTIVIPIASPAENAQQETGG